MKIIDVNHIAKLANLTLEKDEVEKFQKQLSEVLDYISRLNELNTTDIEPTSQVTGLENVTRDDKIKPSLTQEEALSNAASQHNGLFRVKGVFENE